MFDSLRWLGAEQIIGPKLFCVEGTKLFIEVFPRLWHYLADFAAPSTLRQATEINV